MPGGATGCSAFMLGLPGRYRVRVECALAIPMSDGVVLRADHYAPRAAGRFPTLVQRTPYGRRHAGVFSLDLLAELQGCWLASQGYHVLIQLVRGRFDSAGSFTPLAQEQADGAARLAWVAAHP